jgi:hypothetical protein
VSFGKYTRVLIERHKNGCGSDEREVCAYFPKKELFQILTTTKEGELLMYCS